MALKDRIDADINRVFLNLEHFASWHTWNGREFLCVTDEEAAMKRKNNNVIDVSWDNNTTETVVYCRKKPTRPDGKDAFPGRIVPNEHGLFDARPVKILQVQEDMGMLTILLVSNEPKAVM